MTDKFKLGSKELKKELEGEYAKFALGIPVNIEIITDEVEKRIVEFEKDGEKKIIARYDIKICIDGINKIWSISKKVLNTINEHIKETSKFKIILRETQYEVIPLGLK